jgi:hypothetical protein
MFQLKKDRETRILLRRGSSGVDRDSKLVVADSPGKGTFLNTAKLAHDAH